MTATPAEAFETWCRFLAPTEGRLSLDPTDPGNWTSGKPGVGRLVGTMFGIAASSHPDVDIPNLTIETADHIRKTDYWDKINGDNLPPPVAFVVADAAYGSGPRVAAEQLQAMLGVGVDGDIGPHETIPAVLRAIAKPSIYPDQTGLDDVLEEYNSRRLLFENTLSIWAIDKGGWTRRLFRSLSIAKALA